MELEKVGDGDHSTEMLSALKRFEDVCNSLEDEHTKLLELEKRRKKLNEDLERLRNEIKEEKDYFRSAIDESFGEELQNANHNSSTEQLSEVVEPMNLDTGAIKEFIKNQREELTSRQREIDLKHLKENLKQYQESYLGEQFEDIERQEQHAATTCAGSSEESQAFDVCKDDDTELRSIPLFRAIQYRKVQAIELSPKVFFLTLITTMVGMIHNTTNAPGKEFTDYGTSDEE